MGPLGAFLQHQEVRDPFRIVTVTAVGGLMGAFEDEPGQVVVEGVGLHANQCEVSAQVFLVACPAVQIVQPTVVSLFHVDARLKGTMAGEAAIRIGSRDPELMAPGAVGDSFEARVDLGEFSGRDQLAVGCVNGPEAPGQSQEESGDSPPASG